MADQNKQQWADALAALHAGEHKEQPEERSDDGAPSDEDDAVRAAAPADHTPPQPPVETRSKPRPASPHPVNPRPASPAPAAPSGAPAPARSSYRPASPTAPPPTDAPPAEAPASTPASRTPPPRRQHTTIIQTIGYRRTIIPVLLTAALILWVLATWMLIRSDSAILGRINPLFPAIMIVTGFGLLVLGVFNMIQVKGQLEAKRTPAARSART